GSSCRRLRLAQARMVGQPARVVDVELDRGLVDRAVRLQDALDGVQRVLQAHCAIDHTTIQIDVDHARGLRIQPRLSQPQEAP
ncbi:MAG: hypothetical protein ACKOT0_10395, partial [bacterium]